MGIKRGALHLMRSVTYGRMLPHSFGASLFFLLHDPLPKGFARPQKAGFFSSRLWLTGIKRGALLLNGSVTYSRMLLHSFGASLFFCSMILCRGDFSPVIFADGFSAGGEFFSVFFCGGGIVPLFCRPGCGLRA